MANSTVGLPAETSNVFAEAGDENVMETASADSVAVIFLPEPRLLFPNMTDPFIQTEGSVHVTTMNAMPDCRSWQYFSQ